ncbi:hypothetical protein Godav_011741 [Gossypium davidsonii]|uniref:Uncharacterized protein n=1 Tax=Gossypium davidsonii TaxID=34287 RepID=A0A7J8RBV1_GOSDV|nr:hypothetical protein [Gossypium davidsonii]
MATAIPKGGKKKAVSFTIYRAKLTLDNIMIASLGKFL